MTTHQTAANNEDFPYVLHLQALANLLSSIDY
jgi:hypothetical protein